MTIVSLTFLVFIFALLVVYYIVPKRFRWIVLLAASIVFYLFAGLIALVFLLATSVTIYFAARGINSNLEKQRSFIKENKDALTKEEKKEYKAKCLKKRRLILILTLVFNFGILCVLKYFHFAVGSINSIISLFHGTRINDTWNFIIPLGISFYTFQSTGYLLDVYWERFAAEKNYFKTLLFISFFPQITQGPIGKFDRLAPQLYEGHDFDYGNYSRGMQRMLWGFVKKMLLADVLAPYVQDVFANYASYSSLTVLIGMFMYSIQIYADFSGYMDIMCGYCETLGIKLDENFMRPYFSKSIAEYWRRWHITLGDWFKNYIYYPIGISKWNRKLAVAVSSKAGKRMGFTIPATVALVIVWLATGLWHGASWAYVVWGLVNGLFIILSMWLEPVYGKMKSQLHINDKKRSWAVFCTLRTFVLVTFIKVLPEVGTLSQGLGLFGRIFTGGLPRSLHALLAFMPLSSENLMKFAVAACVTIALFVCSMIQRKRQVRDIFNKIPVPLRVMIYVCIFLVLIMFKTIFTLEGGGFMYEKY